MVPGDEADQRATLQYTLQTAWKQRLKTVTIALIITVVAVGVAMAGTTIAEAVVGAAAGAAAGVGILQSQWEEEGRTQAAVAVTAVAGGLAGTAAIIMRSLVVTQSLTGSAVAGTIAGAAKVAITRTQLQWAINITQRSMYVLQLVLALVKRIKVAVQWGRKLLPTATLIVGPGAAAIATAASGGTSPAESTLIEASQAKSTASPAESAATPAESTAPPAESTAPPAESAAPPTESTTTPAESAAPTAESAESAAPPAESAAPPTESTAPPTESTAPPAESTAPSAESAGPSAESAGPSAESTAPTAESTAPPTESAAPPAESAATPAESAAPTAESTAPPAESAAPPAESTAPPAESTAPSAESAGPSAESAATPAESAAPLAESAAPPTESTAPPTESATTPAESTEPPAPSAESAGPSAESAGPSAESTAPTAESTAPPTESAAPPAESAATPAESAAPTAESTAPPAESAAPPAESTAPPAESTAPSAESAGPSAESAGPSPESTAPPTESATRPAESAAPPAESTAPPAESTAPPADSTAPPAESAAPPTESTTIPAESAAPTAKSAATPAESAAPPVESAAPPTESTAPPTESATTPAESTAPPAESAAPPAESTAPPADSAAPPAESAAAPAAESAAPPAESTAPLTESAAESAATPAESAATPAESTAPPLEAAAPAAEPAAPPAESTAPPQAEAAAPPHAEAAASPAESKAPPAESTAPPAESTAPPPAESTATQEESTAPPAEAAAPPAESSAPPAESTVLEVSQARSAALEKSSPAELATSKASKGVCQVKSAASGGASQVKLAGSGRALQVKSAASGGASQAVSPGGASLAASAVSGGVSLAASAASGGASAALGGASAASGGASLVASTASGRATLAASMASGGASLAASAVSGGTSLAASAASGGASTALGGASAASGGASLAASTASGGASLAASMASGGASLAASMASGGASLAASAASLVASAITAGASQDKSAASGGASQNKSTASGGASLAASKASGGALLAASKASGGALLAASMASGGASLAASLVASAITAGESQDKSAASGGASQDKSAASGGASQDKSAASGGASQDKSAASGIASKDKSAASGGASQDKSAASGGASKDKSAASGIASKDKSAASGEASQYKSAASGGASQDESVASGGESQDNSAASGEASQDKSAASGEASQDKSAASGGVSQDESAASGGASQDKSAASGGASQDKSAASGGASQDESAASGGASQDESAASGGASQDKSAASGGASQDESAASGGASQDKSAASGEASQDESAASPAELAGAIGLTGGLLGEGSQGHRQLQTKAAVMGENPDIGTSGVRPDQHLQQEKCGREKIRHLFHKLHLEGRHHNKLRAADILQITAHSLQSHESCAEEELIQTFLQKLLMMNYRARYIHVNKASEHDHAQRDNDSSEDGGDIFKAVTLSNKRLSQSERIHPMDVQMALFHSADGFLKQMIVTKLSQCQYALPLLVPDPFTQQIEFPLWTFRQNNKSWKMRNTNNDIISQTQPIYKAETSMVFFFRFGSVSSSKSQLMNSLINEKHNTFFHRNCPGSSRTRVLMDGVVEIAWFCPSGKNTDKFTDCDAFCNLHGDARDHEKQLQILTEMASVNVVLLPRLDRNDRSAGTIQNLYKNRKPLICLFTEDESTVIEMTKWKFKIGLKDRNQSDVSEELRRAIHDCLSDSSSSFRLEDVSKHSYIRVDEKDYDHCRRGKEAAQQMMSLLEKKHLTEIKESVLPCQGKLWHQWCQKNKELRRPRGDETAVDISRKRAELKKIREQQYESDTSEFMKLFIKEINLHDEHERKYFIKWLRILLDEHISADLSALHHKYDKQWSTVLQLKENHDKSEQLKTEQTGLERISEELHAASVGLEHIMREIGQIYESCSSVKKNKKDLQFDFSSFPSLAAEMMISGFPLELMDGDAAHVPLDWISAVLDQLIQKLGDQRVFVLSVLGLQSSGKSTMLNAMFGLQFAVSAGRCTRGAFMQLVRLSDEMKTQMNFDYILVVDTEGLRALELAGRSTRDHDNELATFVVGLGNLSLINIFGENPSEMQDILQIVVQAFMRMKKVRHIPRCVFVHQNISDIRAGEKHMEGRRRLQKTLDEMTKLAAEEEVCDAGCFSDVIKLDIHDDVKYFAQLWEGSPPMAPPNLNYCDNIQELKETIMFYAAGLHGMRLTHLKDHINNLWEALLNERFIKNSLEISAYRKLETEYSKWTWRLRSAMMETEIKLHNKMENEAIHEVEETDLQRELKTTSEEVEKSMFEFFEKDKDKNILIQWKTSFEIKIKEIQENIVRETKRKLNEFLQQRDLKKKIDARKTHHENTLYEKSKELSLKLKDKAKDEETLKKEFDLLWKKSVKKIISDTPPIKDINIMRDAREIFSDVYRSVSVDRWKESMDIFSVPSYYVYVKEKRSSGFFTKTIISAKERLGYVLSKEDVAQIRSLVTDVAQKTAKMIQSFNISKMGYNISCIKTLIDYIKRRVTEHQEGSVKYKFKNEFFIDLVYSICNGANKMITDQHMMFREANSPVIYVEKKREEYYSIFKKYCHRATSAAIFGEIICQKLKEPIEQSVYKKTARELAGEMRSNCEALNGNRSNLEKHILKRLVEEEDFNKYMNYIHNPSDHFKSFIRDEVSRYITDKFSVSVLPKMKENIKLLEQKIMKAAHESTEHVQENRDAGLWLKSFKQRLSDELIFSEKTLSGVKYVDDFSMLEDEIRQELPATMSDISIRFNTESFSVNLDYEFRPDELLIDHFCQCCWVQCPFCRAICTNTIENHDGDHNVPLHRVTGINGLFYREKTNLAVNICTSVVASRDHYFYPNASDDVLLCREYRTAGGVYADWSITSDLSALPYWKWFLCRFQKHLEKYYNKTFKSTEIPDEWRKYSKQDAIESLDQYF